MGPFPEPKVSMTTPFSGGCRKVRTCVGRTQVGGALAGKSSRACPGFPTVRLPSKGSLALFAYRES